MDKFIERKNIAHYIDQLKTETDPTKRNTLQTLLTEETCRLKQVDATQALNLSAGVSNVKVLRGRSLS
jgi:hypothetical protein